MRILLISLVLILTGCDAIHDYPRNRVANQMVAAQNFCLEHGGVDTFNVRVDEWFPGHGPIQGVTCMDEKYFSVPSIPK